MSSPRNSCDDVTKRDIPSFIEARQPLITNPYLRPRPTYGKNLYDLLEDSDCDEAELVQVYLRLKPCNQHSNLYEVRSERSLITSLDTTTAGHGRRTQHNVSKLYTFTHIFGPQSDQTDIFEQVVKNNLKKLPDGSSFTLLTYGASGSGKTFTLMGTVTAPGLVPRSLEYVFKLVDAAQQPLYKPGERGAETLSCTEQDYELKWVKRLRQLSAPVRDKYKRMSIQLGQNLTSSNVDLTKIQRHYVWVSFIEIYNESIYDLLVPGDRRHANKLAIREDSSGNVYVKGATQAFVRSGEEAYDVMVAGKHNLQVAATGIHAQSSRSHCIFTITMLTETESGMRSAHVRLCDLAGCERASRTRNTGARMQESRAINSSLHVLERCLRTLRRKRNVAAVVPYRESKLTRLLGSGLSGTRGEAVSMVVTVNPAPEYANETRHVLQLAAVAKDIQINDTTSEYPSTLESTQSIQDSILGHNSYEMMKLRSENERLLFELKQAQVRYDELKATMDEVQAANSKNLWEIKEETKEMYTDYYEGQLKALQDKMDEMAEEYESRQASVTQSTVTDDCVKLLENQITELMKERAILEENLSAERLARERLEQEMQHLRACIEERDANTDTSSEENEDVVSLTDSDDSDFEDDTNTESLEPTFTKEDINRSRIIRQSMILNGNSFIIEPNINEEDDDLIDNDDKLNDSTDGKNVNSPTRSNDSDGSIMYDNEIIATVKKASAVSRCTYIVDQVNDIEITKTQRDLTLESHSTTTSEYLDASANDKSQDAAINNKDQQISKAQRPHSRETYCVPNPEVNMSASCTFQKQIGITDNQENPTNKTSLSREKYCVLPDVLSNSKNDLTKEPIETKYQGQEILKPQRPLSRETYCVPNSEDFNVSENGEIATNNEEFTKTQRPLSRDTYCVPPVHNEAQNDLLLTQVVTIKHAEKDINKAKRLLSRETYCVPSEAISDEFQQQDDPTLNTRKDDTSTSFDNVHDIHLDQQKQKSKSVKKNNETVDSLKDNMPEITLKSETQNDKRSTHNILPNAYVSKMMGSLKQSSVCNESLVQFERLEMETNVNETDKERMTKEFYYIKHNKESRKYFDEGDNKKCSEIAAMGIKHKDSQIQIKDKKRFFENIDAKTEMTTKIKQTEEIVNDLPSLSKTTPNDHEPSMIKKLLVKSIQPKTELSSKAHDSLDIFEELDSPGIKNDNVQTHIIFAKNVNNNSDDKIVTSNTNDINTDSIKVTKTNCTNDTDDLEIKSSKKEAAVDNIKDSSPEIKNINNLVKEKSKTEIVAHSNESITTPVEVMTNDTSELTNSSKNNTTVEFENIFKDITAPRATEFDLLVSQDDIKDDTNENSEIENVKYNLRNKTKVEIPKTERKSRRNKLLEEEVLLESHSKCESKSKPPRMNLRLRRNKTNSEDNDGKDTLKDIVNLQSEFSDVTMDIPAPVKMTKDMPTPEKVENQENSPVMPLTLSQAKSVTRSRRKLFTPRAEPLEETVAETGDSTDKVHIQRPSYHRPRARRKL
ncbi:kinesin-like protein KIF20B [Bicyclus anynana]|uniref:Kinesin-like protein KIF20B n=1 Tax=Bicyclus anynana TaxID=110368 RepID=A0A6J1NDE5_BICAN|nr:kinesin-like protein KIF20B [Bicyclus anynana]